MVKLIRGFYTYIRLFFFNGDMSILPDLTGPNLKTGTESRHDWTMEDLVTSIMSPMSWAAPMVRIGFHLGLVFPVEKGYTASWLHVYRRRKEQRLEKEGDK